MKRLFGKCATILLVVAFGAAIPAAQAQQNTMAINIPAQPLGDALTQLSRQTSLQIFFTPELVAGHTAPAVSGNMEPSQVLDQLLSGSGLKAHQGQGGEYVVEAASNNEAELAEVKVTAASDTYPGGQVAKSGRVGLLGDRDVMDTPFNVTNYTAQTIQDQQVRSITDVITNNSPSVRGTWGPGGYATGLMIRGFSATQQDFSFNGLYGVIPGQQLAPELVDRVEVLEGPSALINGMAPNGSIGGSINVVPKRAGENPISQFTALYASDAQFGGHIDLGKRFGANQEFGIRFNGLYRDGDTTADHQSQELGGAMLDMDYRGSFFRIFADLGVQQQNYKAPFRPYSLAAGAKVPAAPEGSVNPEQPWTYADSRDNFGTIRAEIDLNPNWTAYAAYGKGYNNFYSLNQFVTIGSANGNFSGLIGALPAYLDRQSEEVGLNGHLQTGPISHDVALSVSEFNESVDGAFPAVSTFSSNIYNPSYIPQPSSSTTRVPAFKSTEITLSSVALADVISAFDGNVQLIPGVRKQTVQSKNYNATGTAVTAHYDQDAVTPTVALIVKPWGNNLSLYANYIEGLQQGSTAPTTALNSGEVFPPYKSKQYETGVKANFHKQTVTLSLFQIQRPSALTNPTTLIYSIDGEQRNRGIEINTFGEIVENVRLMGGIVFIDAEQTETQGGINNGKDAVGVSKTQANLSFEWDTPLVRGLTLTARGVYTSSLYLNAANTQKIPDWTIFSIGGRYALSSMTSQPIILRANIENLFNRSYWANGLFPGAPRTFLLSATVDF